MNTLKNKATQKPHQNWDDNREEANFLAAARMNAIRRGVRWKDSYDKTANLSNL